ncbi:MAG: hypothetical protein A2142_01570 [candidate division Zixibacteria bacterium RBG_16_48_11]|nr:MAG: hypothetical protein A2142_01570 [candidate division Zixibacteria bacterium RBG_16_48_11]
MPFKFSRCLCLQRPQRDKIVEFYQKVMGLELAKQEYDNIELKADPFRIFFDQGAVMGPIMEFYVPDLEKAKTELLAAGCQVLRWEGKGGCCYMKDPFGFVFNLWEEPEAFNK